MKFSACSKTCPSRTTLIEIGLDPSPVFVTIFKNPNDDRQGGKKDNQLGISPGDRIFFSGRSIISFSALVCHTVNHFI